MFIPVASAALAVVIAGAWWAHNKALRPGAETGVPAAVAQHGTEEEKTLAVVLSGGMVRSGEQRLQEVVIPPGIRRMRLEARFDADFPVYEAVLRTAEGKPVLSQTNLKAEAAGSARGVHVTLSSSELPSGDYILTLRGLTTTGAPETVSEYAFRVRQE